VRHCYCIGRCRCRAGCLDVVISVIFGPIIILCIVLGLIEWLFG
jgi:hypothetical protein